MAIVTAADVVTYSDISTSAAGVLASGLIPIVQDRINSYCNNMFVSDDIYMQDELTFTSSATVTAGTGNDWVDHGFKDLDEIYIYNSRRNDGYYTVTSVTTVTMTLGTGTVTDEYSGASILVSLVRWPDSVKYAAAQMVKFDYDDRPSRAAGLRSQSLGPRSESYGEAGAFGYPQDILGLLDNYRVARLM